MKPNIFKYIIFLILSLIFVALVVYLNLYLPVDDNLRMLNVYRSHVTKPTQILIELILTLYYLTPFLVVVYYSEKYYLNPTQNRWLLLKLPLIGILTSIFFLFVYLWSGSSIQYGSSDDGMLVIFLLIFELFKNAILAVFGFIVASMILYSYKNNKVNQFIAVLFRRSSIIMVLLLILATVYISALIIDISSCGVYGIQKSDANWYNEECFARKAFEQNDPLICEKSLHPSMCFTKLAVKAKDKNICNKINDSIDTWSTKDDCYQRYITETGDDSACSLINQRLKKNWGMIPRYCDE